jgi:integral membrane sensor domain MASE1
MPVHRLSSRLARLLPTTHSLPVVAGLAAVYFVAGKLGLQLAIVHPSATAVWAETGIALAAILLSGYGVWPGIFLGAFAVNLTTVGSILSSLGIATGNTVRCRFGAQTLPTCTSRPSSFNRTAGA